jgi:hypothetical protein
MRIESSAVSLTASHHSLTRDQRQETLRVWRGNQRPDFEGLTKTSENQVSLSQAAHMQFAIELPPAPAIPAPSDSTANAIDAALKEAENDPFLSLIRSMIEALTGHTLRSFSTGALQKAATTEPAQPMPAPASATAPANPQAGYGIEYDASRLYEEYEQTRFSAEGVVVTADGQEIRFSLELEMERYYREETNISLRAGDAVRKDPLVLNFNGNAAQLLDQRFHFDLDADGRTEEIGLLAGGSGFLAFDRNQNGRIDNGTELFGPATNHGFAELAKLDSDGNGWLDEADILFKSLSIWRPEQDGPGLLSSLADEHVGAISLAELATPFALRSNENKDLGQIRSSGVYLSDNGHAGSLQEIDLTI